MNDDPLIDSLRALRESTDGASERAAHTRKQILAQADLRTRRKRRIVALLMPLAAAFFVTTAWGAAAGRLPRWLDIAFGRGGSADMKMGPRVYAGTEPAAPLSPSGLPPATSVTIGAPTATSAMTATSEPIPTPSSATTEATDVARASGTTASKKTASASAAEQSLYAKAHQAHFVDHDPASALRGWDTYLAAYPDGRFALEARYNRAISLVRLGRREAAREELAPYADGRFGGYRQAEARALLDALGDD